MNLTIMSETQKRHLICLYNSDTFNFIAFYIKGFLLKVTWSYTKNPLVKNIVLHNCMTGCLENDSTIHSAW